MFLSEAIAHEQALELEGGVGWGSSEPESLLAG